MIVQEELLLSILVAALDVLADAQGPFRQIIHRALDKREYLMIIRDNFC